MSNNTIIMVNSFKGGAGKTSIALSLCMTAAYKEPQKSKKDIYYIDLDILGTAAEYAIFNESKVKEIKHMSLTEIETVENKVNFDYHDKKNLHFKAFLSHPNNRLASNYAGTLSIRSNAQCLNGIFADKILDFIDGILKKENDSIIVLDCSPGLSPFEKYILDKLYDKQEKKIISKIHEVYVTTLDVSHIKKTISSIIQICKSNLKLDMRNIKIIVNDIVDLKNLGRASNEEKVLDMEQYKIGINTYIKTEIKKEFKEKHNTKQDEIMDKKISIIFNKYSMNLIKSKILFCDIDMKNEDSIPLEKDAEPYFNIKLYDEVIKGESR